MGRTPCCDKQLGLKKGPWTPEEDKVLVDYIQANGHGSWRSLPKLAGLQRCGKSCRLRWANYLRPDIKRGPFTEDEQKSIIQLHGIVGNKWSAIAGQLPGRTDNEIKNFWNTHLKKRLQRMGINPDTYSPSPPTNNSSTSSATSASTTTSSAVAARHMAQWESARLEAEARLHLFSNNTNINHEHEHVDIFLRIWNSDVGEAFRRTKKADNEEASQSSAITVSEANNAETETVGELKNEAEETSEEDETYRFYLDLAAGDDLSLLQVNQSCYSLLLSDLSEASLDNPF